MRQDVIKIPLVKINKDLNKYKGKVLFEKKLQKANELLKNDSDQLKLAQTDGDHIPLKSEAASKKATLFFRDGHMARNDGNSVDIDVETTEMSKNSIMFNALVQANKKSGSIFRSVIDASQKVNKG